ncbi:MAG: hypothetical protein CME36_19905 [unclassified Hahellaceae]|nr:hypothetical protein [Hahellaceae bacterium]|tara:strand:+ start:13336 stop:14097 length:762 start_codon:yes stop_codon:yes gene_type:complete
MTTKAILILWDETREVVVIDLSKLDSSAGLEKTIEYWPKENKRLEYKVRSSAEMKGGVLRYVFIEYHKEDNPTIAAAEDALWGRTVLEFAGSGELNKITWEDDSEEWRSGPLKWREISMEVESKGRSSVSGSRSARAADFRAQTLMFDNACVVSGETFSAALEAAHVLPVKGDGSDSSFLNGITLRADLHRLYDAGEFSINERGEILAREGLSESYKEMLTGKHIPPQTLKRIGSALRKRNGGQDRDDEPDMV